MKPLPGTALTLARRAEMVYSEWVVEIDNSTTPIEWIFQPQFWIHVSGHLKKDDKIRLLAKDRSYDLTAVVTGKTTGGKLAARIKLWPIIPDYVIAAAAAVSATEMTARMVNGKPVPRVEHVEVDGWRVVGFDNTVHSKGYETEANAQIALGEYLHIYGIKSVAKPSMAPAALAQMEADKREPSDKLPKELDVSFGKRRDADKREARDAQRKADLEQLEQRRQEIAARNQNA